mgnify:CR=1 FL=1
MNQLNHASRIKKLQYTNVILLIAIAAAGFMESDQTRFAWTICIAVIMVMISLAIGSYYEELRKSFQRFGIGIKEGLEVAGTEEFDELNHKPIVEQSIDIFQALVELHRRSDRLAKVQNQDDLKAYDELSDLKELITKRADYISNMSHELRTPLNSIIGFAELILLDISENNFKSVGADTEKIRNAGTHLLDLINGILDLARLDANKTELHIGKVNIYNLVTFLEELLSPQFATKKLEYKFSCADELPLLLIDSGRVRQVLLNILGNAIKFTEHGRVTLDVRKVFWKDRDFICFSVTDDGPGISKENIGQIFERFVQVHDPAKVSTGGSGLGLSLAKGMVNLMGGEIQVESEIGKGTTFRVFIPLILDSGDQVAEQSVKILIVEDDSDARETWREWLASEGYDVFAAENGQIAFEVFKREQPRLVITDVIMPGGGGRELVANLQQTAPDVPVIIVTGENLAADKGAARMENVAKIFLKPFDPVELSNEVERLTSSGK